jgi:hypothetical protein
LCRLEIRRPLERWSNNAPGFPPPRRGRRETDSAPLEPRIPTTFKGNSLRAPNEVLVTMPPLKSRCNGIIKGIAIIPYQLGCNWLLAPPRKAAFTLLFAFRRVNDAPLSPFSARSSTLDRTAPRGDKHADNSQLTMSG